MRGKLQAVILIIIVLLLTETTFAQNNTETNELSKPLNLNKCLELAKKNHPLNLVNKSLIGISKAQVKQAKSAYFPQINLAGTISTMDEEPKFSFPASKMQLPAIVPGVELAPIEIPAQHIKVMDKTFALGSLDITYPLYSGGLISSYNQQAKGARQIADVEVKHNKMQIETDVKKRFYAVYLMQKLTRIGNIAVERLETTLELTKNLYLKGSGKVNKTDYLKNKIMVDNIVAINKSFKHNLELAKVGLLNAIGVKEIINISVDENSVKEETYDYEYADLLTKAFETNTMWNKLKIAENIFEAKIDEAFSGYLPKIGLFGGVKALYNSYEYGIATKENKLTFMVGIGLKLPIFNGFRTSAKVEEADYQLAKIKSQKKLLENGLHTLVKKALIDFESAKDQRESLKSAMISARDNRDLNDRAYQSDLVELEDLIQAQLFEAIMEVQYYKAEYTYYEKLFDIELTIGKRLK